MPRLVAPAHFPSDPDSEGFSRSDYSRIERVPVHQDSSVSPENRRRLGIYSQHTMENIDSAVVFVILHRLGSISAGLV